MESEMKEKTDISEMQRIIRDYSEHFYVNKLENLDDMEKFLEAYSFPRLNQEDRTSEQTNFKQGN